MLFHNLKLNNNNNYQVFSLQFRLAYVSPESRVVGAGDLVDHPKKIALHYLKGYFLFDLFVVFPLPQVKKCFNYVKKLIKYGVY